MSALLVSWNLPHCFRRPADMHTGDPDEGGIIKQSMKSVLEGMLPHKGD